MPYTLAALGRILNEWMLICMFSKYVPYVVQVLLQSTKTDQNLPRVHDKFFIVFPPVAEVPALSSEH